MPGPGAGGVAGAGGAWPGVAGGGARVRPLGVGRWRGRLGASTPRLQGRDSDFAP